MSNVLPFPTPRTRGRPKKIREEKDFGTPELQIKRTLGETAEALDLCLEKGIITPEQHWCGTHLRWLYTLRYGAPGIRAMDLNHVSGLEIKADDPNWRQMREAEYHHSFTLITKRGYGPLLTNICIYNERPAFLQSPRKNMRQNSAEIEKLRDGLELLVKHWKREKENKA